MHCQLEAVPGFEFIACVTEDDCHNEPSSDHGDEGCCLVEKSEYKINQTRLAISASDLVLLGSTLELDFHNAPPTEVSSGVLTAAPPELSQTWQFISRTALPVRAPSVIS